jgi:hypothetical protein
MCTSDIRFPHLGQDGSAIIQDDTLRGLGMTPPNAIRVNAPTFGVGVFGAVFVNIILDNEYDKKKSCCSASEARVPRHRSCQRRPSIWSRSA